MARCIDAEAVDAGLIDEPQRPSLEISADGRVLRVEIRKPGEPAVLDALLVREVDRTEVVEPADVFIVGEPWMTVPKVVDHDIEHDLEALRVSRADERREERVHAGTRTAASRAPTVIPPLTRFRVRRSTRLPSGRHTSVGKSPVLIATYMSSRGASGGASGLIDVRRYA